MVREVLERARTLAATMRRLSSTTFILVIIGISACTAPGRQSVDPLMPKPATWTSAVMDPREIDRDTVLIQYIVCHPEPTDPRNTILRVWEISSTAPSTYRKILRRKYWYASANLDRELQGPITRSDVGGLEALTLEINSYEKSPTDGSIVHYNSRFWTVPFSKRVVFVAVHQPIVPDPNCSPELEKTIQAILLRLAAEQGAPANAPQKTRR